MSDVPSEQLLSHNPGPPAPVPVRMALSAHPCSYFPNRESRSRAFWATAMPGDTYHRFMDAGFRRSGKVVYQPVCAGCRACVPIRVPVATFAPDKSQRRCWRKNQDLVVTAGDPEPTAEKFAVYDRYRRQWHDSEEPHDYDTFTSFLYDSPVDTVEFWYRDPAGKLLGVGICDVCGASLSSVYFYFDPDESRHSLGTFSAMYEIEWARAAGIPHYYLGFWIAGCGAMEYKANFRPYELLGTDGVWRPG
jgi:arginine-tRNA-protein transferase